jgi:hypothetical protein
VILGRPVALWNSLVVAVAAAVVALVPNVTAQQVAVVVAITFSVIGLLANQANNGSPLGRAK